MPSGNTFPVLTIERGSMIFFGSKNAHSLKNQLQTCSPPKKVNLAGNDIIARYLQEKDFLLFKIT